VLDYVVVHELVHLKHMNHSKEFWDTVTLYNPEYKKAVAWLKENGGKLKLRFEKEEVC
jgi:predicted metal-dependent hydrolase